MADEFGDKTEAPTPRRRQEAREQGRIPRSPDLTAAAVLLAMLLMLKWYGPTLVYAMRAVLERSLSQEVLADHNAWNVGDLLLAMGALVTQAMLPMLLGVALFAIFANLLQVGLFFNTKRLQPNFGALNPVKGYKRLFGRGNGAMQTLMNLAKVTLVGLVAYSAIHDRLGEVVQFAQLEFIEIFGLGIELVYSMILRLGTLLFVLALFDYAWQRWKIERDLKMSKHEVKEELKKMEGDPTVKQRRRQIAFQRAMQRIQSAVPTADVIVTNPTEYAVALKYEQGMTAPKVVAKGRGFIAQKIREIAIENGVPILERPPLARALWRMVEVGQEIPEQFYSAVAEILAYVYELTGKARRAVA